MEEEANEVGFSTQLPPLRPDNKNKEPSLGSNGEVLDPALLKKRLLKIYPQLQKAEKEIHNIKQQLPLNLNKTVLNIRQQVERLYEAKSPTFSGESSSNVQKILSQLEERLNQRVKKTLDDSSAEIEEKFNKIENNSPIDNEINKENESSLNFRAISLETLNSQYQKRLNSRLADLEQSISKIALTSVSDNATEIVKSVKDSLDVNIGHLSFIKSKIDELQSRTLKQKALQESAQRKMQEEDNIKSSDISHKKLDSNYPPDLTEPMLELQGRIQDFNKLMAVKTEEIAKKSKKCEEVIEQLDQMACDLTESTKELESHATETEGLCNDLSEATQRISKQLNEDKNYHLIQTLSMQIKSVHDSIRSEIGFLNKRLSHIELSVSLVNTDKPEAVSIAN